jgi:nucleoid-associated protein YgaU
MFARLALLGLLAALIVAVAARQSTGAGPERAYVVRPGDTLWAIAAARYGGDPREAVWKIERRNHLSSALIHPGQRLVLPAG